MMGVFDPRSHQDSASRGGSPFQDGRAQTCQKIQQRSTIWENAISDERDMLKCLILLNKMKTKYNDISFSCFISGNLVAALPSWLNLDTK